MQKANFQQYDTLAELENARALQAFSTSYTERFHLLMKLIKVSSMIQNAKIISSPKIPETP